MPDPQPAGWYPAAHAGNDLRYWDGTRWLDWTPEQAAEAANRPVPPGPPTDATPPKEEPELGSGTPPQAGNGADSAPIREASAREAKRRKPLLIAGVASALVLACGVTAFIVMLTQPSALERAGAECSGSKPFTAFLEDVRSSASPDAASTPGTNSSELEDLFDGVVTVEDGGKTLIVSTKPQDDDAAGLTSLALDCVFEQLDVPASVTARINQTRALDGRQDGKWNGFTASWSYHPDAGANLIIVED